MLYRLGASNEEGFNALYVAPNAEKLAQMVVDDP
jgi:hypothetical protein